MSPIHKGLLVVKHMLPFNLCRGLSLLWVALHCVMPGTSTAGEPMVVGPAETKPAASLPYVTEYPEQAYSPQIAVVSGDPGRTPISMFIRMRRGTLPMHMHTSSYQAVVIQGRMKHWAKSESETVVPVLEPGSWWMQPGGDIHTDSCLDDECLLYVHTDGRLDTIVDR